MKKTVARARLAAKLTVNVRETAGMLRKQTSFGNHGAAWPGRVRARAESPRAGEKFGYPKSDMRYING
eukprot:1345149-Amorphochlora_amoeboformis.AAC.2